MFPTSDGNLYAIGLSREERRAILGVLEDLPDGLAELRGVLMRCEGLTAVWRRS